MVALVKGIGLDAEFLGHLFFGESLPQEGQHLLILLVEVCLQGVYQLALLLFGGVHGLFEDEFRKRNVKAFWMPHALPDCRTVSRAEIRRQINDYMTTVMHEEPLDPSLLDFDDSMTW